MQFKVGRLESFCADVLRDTEYFVVRTKVSGSRESKTVQVMIEKDDGDHVTIMDCEKASRLLSVALDQENIVRGNYNLEISSCGINRPLINKQDFVRFCGNYIVLRLCNPVDDRSNLSCLLKEANDSEIIVEYEVSDADLHKKHDTTSGRHIAKTKKKLEVSLDVAKATIRYDDIVCAHVDGFKNKELLESK